MEGGENEEGEYEDDPAPHPIDLSPRISEEEWNSTKVFD